MPLPNARCSVRDACLQLRQGKCQQLVPYADRLVSASSAAVLSHQCTDRLLRHRTENKRQSRVRNLDYDIFHVKEHSHMAKVRS